MKFTHSYARLCKKSNDENAYIKTLQVFIKCEQALAKVKNGGEQGSTVVVDIITAGRSWSMAPQKSTKK
jgi:hypothetical protein